MIRAAVACLLIALATLPSLAQGSRAESFSELSKRLEEVQRSLQPPPLVGSGEIRHSERRRSTARRSTAPKARVTYQYGYMPSIEKAVTLMESLVADFQNNPWVRVKGFKVTLGFPPSVDVDFEVPPTAIGSTR
jgi:hypothetical protein